MSDQQTPDQASQDAEKKKKKKKDKVRSAWISFVGRIIAQAVGATATVVLGLTVLHSYAAPDKTQAASATQAAGAPPAASAPQSAGDIFVAILPIENVSSDPAGAGKRVRITVQLIDSDDQPAAKVLALQAEIASAIAKAVSEARPPHGLQSVSR